MAISAAQLRLSCPVLSVPALKWGSNSTPSQEVRCSWDPREERGELSTSAEAAQHQVLSLSCESRRFLFSLP